MGDKRIHKTVVLKHGNQYSVRQRQRHITLVERLKSHTATSEALVNGHVTGQASVGRRP